MGGTVLVGTVLVGAILVGAILVGTVLVGTVLVGGLSRTFPRAVGQLVRGTRTPV